MTARRIAGVILAGSLVCSMTARAQSADQGIEDSGVADDPRQASLYAGLELGSTDTHRIDAGGQASFRRHWMLSGQLARAKFEITEGEAVSTVASLRLQRNFEGWGLGAGLRRTEVTDISSSNSAFAGGHLQLDTLRLSAEVEARATDLEPAPFTEDLGPELGVRSGISRCEGDSLGVQLQATLDRPSWSGFVSWKGFEYDDFDCVLTLDGGGNGNGNGNGPPAHARGRALGRRLAAAPLEPITGFGSRLIPREAILLRSSIGLGASLPIDEHWLGGVELYRDSENIGGNHYDTMLAFATRRLDESWSIELTLGFSDAETVDDTSFAGVRATLRL